MENFRMSIVRILHVSIILSQSCYSNKTNDSVSFGVCVCGRVLLYPQTETHRCVDFLTTLSFSKGRASCKATLLVSISSPPMNSSPYLQADFCPHPIPETVHTKGPNDPPHSLSTATDTINRVFLFEIHSILRSHDPNPACFLFSLLLVIY